MKRIIFITLWLISAAARAQETNADAPSVPATLQSLALKNIFDATRSGRSGFTSKPKLRVVLTFTFRGTVDDVALFTGEGVGKGIVKRGDTLNGFKVMKVPVSFSDPIVILTDPTGAIVALKKGESMRREDDGPWTRTDEPPPVSEAASTPASMSATTGAPAGPPLTGGARLDDILKRLRQKREQEDK
jgi:hypothetical protein